MLLSWVYTLLRDPCVYCGEPGSNSIDHIRPKSDGGRTEWENLAPCHSKCNAQKGTYGVLFAQTQALPKEKET
jgi:5-methylcytosine-specific restriction endonuclease McrA